MSHGAWLARESSDAARDSIWHSGRASQDSPDGCLQMSKTEPANFLKVKPNCASSRVPPGIFVLLYFGILASSSSRRRALASGLAITPTTQSQSAHSATNRVKPAQGNNDRITTPNPHAHNVRQHAQAAVAASNGRTQRPHRLDQQNRQHQENRQ